VKSIASLSLDLDNKWSYLKTNGNPQWHGHPSYFDVVVPIILDFLKRRDLTITFFIVGQDASLEKNQPALQSIADSGHEIGNHSFLHEPWLHLYTEDELNLELVKAEKAIERATGQHPTGFRGPGFSLSTGTLNTLYSRHYSYDATAFPNILNPLARAYFFSKSNLSSEERRQRKALFGSASDALRPVKPYYWRLTAGRLAELPVTTMPVFKTPIHFSYLLYLGNYSAVLAKLYFRFALGMCRLTDTQPSLLLHPLDFLGAEDDNDLAFFPGMNYTRSRKLSILGELMDILQKQYNVINIAKHVELICQKTNMKEYSPHFKHDKPSPIGT
jgi:peptidoglycan-N-acetylglucosamine deacetylase